ncbi:MAG: SDR family NAD(P)-dependent oxidoreductase [Burkholderiales bacterium]
MSLNPPLANWQGKTIWLLGASTGIGRATAVALHGCGAHVVVSARTQSHLYALAAQCPGILALPLDCCDAQAVKTTASALLEKGPIDAVMYCAGYYKALRATDYNAAEMLKHQQVNYLGALYMLEAVLPHFLSRRSGHISLVSSVAGYGGLPKSLAYGPTKAALINLAETLYLDLQPQGIGVSLVCPGFVQTPLTAQNDFHMPGLLTPEQAAEAILKGWAKGRFEIHFPTHFTRWMKLMRLLPYRLYFALIRRTTGL